MMQHSLIERSDDAVPPDGITNTAVSAGSAMVHQEHAAR
jgi:hypothetical protein